MRLVAPRAVPVRSPASDPPSRAATWRVRPGQAATPVLRTPGHPRQNTASPIPPPPGWVAHDQRSHTVPAAAGGRQSNDEHSHRVQQRSAASRAQPPTSQPYEFRCYFKLRGAPKPARRASHAGPRRPRCRLVNVMARHHRTRRKTQSYQRGLSRQELAQPSNSASRPCPLSLS